MTRRGIDYLVWGLQVLNIYTFRMASYQRVQQGEGLASDLTQTANLLESVIVLGVKGVAN